MSTQDYYGEFQNYAMKHMGVSGLQFHYWEKLQDRLYGPQASMTPYIIEEREMRFAQIDIFSRLMAERIIWLAGVVNDSMSTIVQAQLQYLDSVNNETITLHVDTPGGSVKSGLSIVDSMNYIASDIQTINTGMAASMGSILLGAGTKGMRFSLPHSRVMLHQVSFGASGNIQDVEISVKEGKKYNDELFTLLAEYCDKPKKQVLIDTVRDKWLTAKEAKDYGIIDDLVKNKTIKKEDK